MQKDRCVTQFLFQLLFTQSHTMKEAKRNQVSGSTVTPGKNHVTETVRLKASLRSTKGPRTSYVHTRIRQFYADGTQEKLVEKSDTGLFFSTRAPFGQALCSTQTERKCATTTTVLP